MRISKRVNLFLMLLLTSTAMATTEKKEANIYTEDKTGITATVDQPTFTIKLKSNPSTGYSWFLRHYHSKYIQPVKHSYEYAADRNLVGAPGFDVYTFKIKREAFTVPQQTMIRFVYARPWENEAKPTQVVFSVSTISAPSESRSQKSK